MRACAGEFALCAILAGCGSSSAGTADDGGAPSTTDATQGSSDAPVGVAADATNGNDASGVPPLDGGAALDSGGGTSPTDSGTPLADASMAPMDATSGMIDSSVLADSGSDSAVKPGDGGALPHITLWLAGDSTVANGETPCPVGWGKEFSSYFNSSVTVTNSAVGGTSIRSWLYDPEATTDSTGECVLPTDSSGQPTVQAHWQAMLDGMKTGDYLFIQFGINDGSTCPVHDGTAAFMTSLGVMASAAKARGAVPIFVTPVSSIACKGSTAYATRGTYATATTEAATQDSVTLIDLETLSVALYNASAFCPLPDGETDITADSGGAVGAFFCNDHTHFETGGATRIAGLMAKAIGDQGLGLAAYLK